MSKPQRLSDASGSAEGGCVQPLGKIERLPKWLLCVPLVAQWFWLGLRYRSLELWPNLGDGGLREAAYRGG